MKNNKPRVSPKIIRERILNIFFEDEGNLTLSDLIYLYWREWDSAKLSNRLVRYCILLLEQGLLEKVDEEGNYKITDKGLKMIGK